MKNLSLLSILISTSLFATNVAIDESKIPAYLKPSSQKISEYMDFSNCEKLQWYYLYLINSSSVRKEYFFVKNFKSENYIINIDKLDKYRFFNKNNFSDYAGKVYRVTAVRYVKVKGNRDSKTQYIELTLTDSENPKVSFKYLNVGKYHTMPHFPFIDMAYYKYQQDKFSKQDRYKIKSRFIKGTSATFDMWWTFKQAEFDDEHFNYVFVFESNEGKSGYINERDAKEAIVMTEKEWTNICEKKGEEYALCKIARIIKVGMSHEDVLDIMGSPNGYMYDSRNIYTGYEVMRYGEQWIELDGGKVTNVDLYKTLMEKGDLYLIDLYMKHLYK